MTWQHPSFLFLLAILPVLILLGIWIRRRAEAIRKSFFSDRLLASLRPDLWESGVRLRNVFLYISLTLLILGLAGPKLGTEVREIEQKGVDLIIGLDLSRSMNAQDIRPSRLEKAKFEISRMIDRAEGNRIGLIVFTGEAFLQSPLTLDHSALRLFLDVADTRQMPTSTTDFASAFKMASTAFQNQTDGSEAGRITGSSRAETRPLDDAADVMLLISDGENQAEEFASELKDLTESGVRVFTVGIGSMDGAPIPVFDEEGSRLLGYHRERSGGIVTSRLQRETLQRIAKDGNGEYYEIGTNSGNLDRFLNRLDELEQGTFSSQEYVDFKHQYQWLVGFGLVFLLLHSIIPETRASNGKTKSSKNQKSEKSGIAIEKKTIH